MPSYPSKPKTLAGDPGLATAGGPPALQSVFVLRWFFAGGEGAR